MMTEEEATASIMDGGACTTCQQLCSMAGKKVEKRKDDCAIKNNANDATISFSIIDEFHPLKEVLIDGVTDEQRKIIEAETYS